MMQIIIGIILYVLICSLTAMFWCFISERYRWRDDSLAPVTALVWPLGLPILLLVGFGWWMTEFEFYISEEE